MDDLEKNQNTPDGESEQPAEEKSVFGGLFKAWSNATEESLLAELLEGLSTMFSRIVNNSFF